jgi:uncharacterized membrane protein
VREILQRNCYECHGQNPKKIEKHLNILDHEQLLASARKIVVPGSPDDSRLIHRIADGSMPPEEEEVRLPRVTEKELMILRDWILGGAPPLPPDDAAHPVPPVVPFSELAAKTKTIFHRHCYECHDHSKGVKNGGIKIMNHRLLVTVRKNVVIPGHPDDSELIELITSVDDTKRMPPDGYERLSDAEIATIRQWILEGAPAFSKEK